MVAGGSLRAGEVQKEALGLGLPLEVSTSEARRQLGHGKQRDISFLPVHGTPFVGREAELPEVTQLLAQHECRLLTMTGVGGVGKTRLAQEVVRGLLGLELFNDGVFFVPLEALTSAGSISNALADALGLVLSGQVDAGIQVVRFLSEKRTLLVLDNFEHLLEGTPLLVDLMRNCPHLKLLVTSRERLNLESEWVFGVEGLAVPKAGGTTLERAGYYSAVQLFVQRAKRAQQRFSLTPEALPAVTRICQLVEGLPLAIEMAASWLRILFPQGIVEQLEKGLDVLEASNRDLPERHSSIRAVFDHSWDLLSEVERGVLRCLSVFHGGFSLEAASEVAEVTLPILASLGSKSFLTLTPAGRYEQHPLVLEYARERLAEQPGDRARTPWRVTGFTTSLS